MRVKVTVFDGTTNATAVAPGWERGEVEAWVVVVTGERLTG